MSLGLMVLVLECDMIQIEFDSLESWRQNTFRIVKEHRAIARDAKPRKSLMALPWFNDASLEAGLVEPAGIEPATSCLQSRRSPS